MSQTDKFAFIFDQLQKINDIAISLNENWYPRMGEILLADSRRIEHAITDLSTELDTLKDANKRLLSANLQCIDYFKAILSDYESLLEDVNSLKSVNH